MTSCLQIEPQANALHALGDSLYFPDAPAEDRQGLFNAVLRLRESRFIADALRMRTHAFDDLVTIYRALTPPVRQAVLMDPTVRVLLRKLSEQGASSEYVARRLRALLSKVKESSPDAVVSEPLGIPIKRLDIDEDLAQALPPSYDVRDPAHAALPPTQYTLSVAKEVIDAALRSIERTWPEAVEEIGHHVRLFIHVLDADFRSCSASRYAGAMILTANDDSVLAVEESLMHEFGHQLLYAIMEVDPLLVEQDAEEYALPWSGNRRDLYGFFHATYIYLLLKRYYARRNAHSEEERLLIADRLQEIASGLREAADVLHEQIDRFTAAGKEFVRRLLLAIAHDEAVIV